MEVTGSFDSGALPSHPSDTDSKLGVQGDSSQLASVKKGLASQERKPEALTPVAASITYSTPYEANGRHRAWCPLLSNEQILGIRAMLFRRT